MSFLPTVILVPRSAYPPTGPFDRSPPRIARLRVPESNRLALVPKLAKSGSVARDGIEGMSPAILVRAVGPASEHLWQEIIRGWCCSKTRFRALAHRGRSP